MKVLRQAERRGGRAPQRHADGDDPLAIIPVGEPGDGDGDRCIEGRKGQAGQQAESAVRDLQVLLDRLQQDAHDLAVHEVQRVANEEHADHVLRGLRGGGRKVRRGRLIV